LLISPSSSELRFLRTIEGLALTTLDIRPAVKPDILADICNMPEIPDAAFDFVYASCVLNCVYDLDAALSEIRRVLRSGGCFLNTEIISPSRKTIERTDLPQITAHYGIEEYEKYRVGGFRSFGALDFPLTLETHFAQVKRVWVLDLPYNKGQWWHVASAIHPGIKD
jgi:SAM-dependent methyltransferase